MDVGLDIGGTKILGAVVDNGRIISTYQAETGAHKGTRYVVGQMRRVIDTLAAGKPISSLTLAVPGPYEGTAVTACLNVPDIVNVDLQEELGLPLTLQRDSTAFALGEYGSRHVSRMLGVIFGTGVSCCSVEDGIPRCYGRKGHACTADVYADRTLEIKTVHDWLGKPGIESRYRSRFGTDATLEQIWAMQDSRSREFQEEIVQHAATYLQHVKRVFAPELIVIGGGQSGSPLIERLRESYPELQVVRSPDTSRSAILGAIALSELSAAPLAQYAVR